LRQLGQSSPFSLAFAQDYRSPGCTASEMLLHAVRPEHFDGINLLSTPKSEVNAWIVTGCETSSGIAPTRLPASTGKDSNGGIIDITTAKRRID
jgi:hypothetical protein